MPENIVCYQPDNCLKQGYFGLFADMFRELAANRWLTKQIMKRDMSAMYKQSIIGFLWLVVNPMAVIATYMILGKSGVFNVGEIKTPYALYAVLGISTWQLFAVGITASANSLVSAGSMISKINFSKKSLVIASIGTSFLSFCIQFVLALALLIVYHWKPSPWIILMPLLAIPMALLSLGLGFLAALLNAVFRDVGTAIPVLINFLLMLTPVLYTPRVGLLAKMSEYNPFYYLTTVPRDIALRGTTDHILGYGISVGVSVFVFVVCLTIFHLTESRIAERV
ncbi:MAG: ABC transporter permease [Armatimonadota bacterium]